MTIHKAVIPVAGLGTRLLPTTKAVPKEMLPAGRLPIIHHVVEELIGAGITRFLFVSNRNKAAIENRSGCLLLEDICGVPAVTRENDQRSPIRPSSSRPRLRRSPRRGMALLGSSRSTRKWPGPARLR